MKIALLAVVIFSALYGLQIVLLQSIIFAIFLLGEKITALQIIGGILIVGSICLFQFQK